MFISDHPSVVLSIAIQLARVQGFSPIIATSSLKHEDYLKSLGATHIIDRSLPSADVLRKIQEITGGKQVVYAYDAIASPETQGLAYDALADGGALVATNPRSAEFLKDKIKEGDGKKVARPIASLHLPGNLKLGEELYNHLTEWLASGVIVVRVWQCKAMRFREIDRVVCFLAEQDRGDPQRPCRHPGGFG